MVDEGVFVTTAEVQRKVGAGAAAVDTAPNDEAHINQFVAEAESLINVTVGENYSNSYSTLDVDVRDILKMAAGAKAAIMVINFDKTGYASGEANEMKNVLKDEYNMCITELRKQAGRDTLEKAA